MPRGNKVDPAKDELVAQIIEYRRCRMPNNEIAKNLGISTIAVGKLYRQALAEYPLTAMSIDEHRAEENDLIDAAIRELMVIAFDHRSMPRSRIDSWLAIERFMERRAKMLGLDAPTRSEVVTLGALDMEIQKLEAELNAPKKRRQLPRGDSA